MTAHITRRTTITLLGAAMLAACGAPRPRDASGRKVKGEALAMYAGLEDNGYFIPPVPEHYLIKENIRTEIDFPMMAEPGSIIVDPWQRYLYHVWGGGRATRYRVAVGNQGRQFAGAAVAQHARTWPSWRPTDNMIREFPGQYGRYAGGMAGGPGNPLGARAIYLYRGGRDTMYRIHGTNEVSSIGHATSAGCIRMYNQDVIHLVNNFRPGAPVIVLSQAQSAAGFGGEVPFSTPYSGASFSQSAASGGTGTVELQPTASADGFADFANVRDIVATEASYFERHQSW